MSKGSIMKGTIILSIAVFLSKILGLIFVIPFNALVGEVGGALYSYAYTPYTILLSLATLGLPLAVSKFVSKYNSLGDYHTGRRLFRTGIVLVTITGFVAFLILYYIAPFIAQYNVVKGSKLGNSVADVTLVIRIVSTALVIIPSMSLIRGYFQGFQSMGPTALSQLIEQLARVAFILIGAYVVMKWSNATETTRITQAVAVATFGATIGGVSGLIVLIRYWMKRRVYLNKELMQSTVKTNISLLEIYKELIAYAIPFVAVGISMSLYQLIDQFTINICLVKYLNYTPLKAEDVFADISMYVQKIIMIPVSLSTALALTVVPTITKFYTEGNNEELQKSITESYQFVLFLTIPASIGLSVLAYDVYGLLYGTSSHSDLLLGADILRWYAPSAILFALFSLTAAILQGINLQKVTILSLGVGILLKMILNPLLIKVTGDIGPILATDIGYLASIIINGYIIKRLANYSYMFILKRTLLISIFTSIMVIGIKLVNWALRINTPNDYFEAIWGSLVGLIVGAGIFILLSFKSGLALQIFGPKIVNNRLFSKSRG